MLRSVVFLMVLLLAHSAALAEKRIALLIGNQDYDASVGKLKNPRNDIAVVGGALAGQGFELIPPIKDAKRSDILGGVRELVRRLNAAGSGAVGFIYYSGHGAAEKDTNINYLIPIDAKEPGTTAFWDESVKLDDILRLLDGARSAAKFVVFDACRNELQLPTKDTTKGLVPIAEQQGMFIAYASAPGRTASDRGDASGPYAAALAAELGKPGLDHLNLFQNVKEAVLASTGGAQQPWESNGLARRIYLTGQAKVSQAPPTTTVGAEAERAWALVKDTSNIAVLEAFIARYKATFFADLAKARLQELKTKQSAEPQKEASSPPPREIAHSTRMGPFDGNWQAVYSGNDYCTHSRHNVEQWTVTNGVMVVQAGARATLSNEGEFHIRWPWLNHPGRVFVVRAKINGSRGKGVFQLEGRQCGGTVTLTRM
jgi:uncharacterized caspase-like protein